MFRQLNAIDPLPYVMVWGWLRPRSRSIRVRAAWPSSLLLADELFAQNVCVPAVLSELAQHVEAHPPQRKRTAPVPVDYVVQAQG